MAIDRSRTAALAGAILAGLFALTQLPMMMREARTADAAANAVALTEVQE